MGRFLTRHLSIGLALVLALLAVGSVGATPTAPSPAASASAYGIRIVVPGGGGGGTETVTAPPDATGFSGGFVYPADGSAVSTGSVTASVSASTSAPASASASASADVSSLSLFGGEITAATVSAHVRASASGGSSSGDFTGSGVTGLTVLGQPAAGGQVALGDWGYAVVAAQSGVGGGTSPDGYRGSATALLVHLNAEHGGLPAGTEIVVGSGEAAAALASSSPASPTTTAATTGTETERTETTETQTTETTQTIPPARPPTAPRPPVAAPDVRPPAQRPAAPAARAASSKPKPVAKTPLPKAPEPLRIGIPQPPLAGAPLTVTPPLGAGPYVFPVYGPSSYIDTWGAVRADVSYHHGDDIFAPLGAPLLAVADGTVFSVGWNDIGGNRLWLRDREGNAFYYAHLSAFTVLAKNGNHVRAGDVLGFVGNSGDAQGTPYHVHFEIHPVDYLGLGYDGAVNPTRYLDAWKHVQDVRFAAAGGWAPPASPASAAPRPGAILLQVSDISTASGLRPGSLERALAPVSSDGDGGLVGLGRRGSSAAPADGER